MLLQACEDEYKQQLAENRVTDDVKFTYSWHLIKSQYKNDIKKGIRLMDGKSGGRGEGRERRGRERRGRERREGRGGGRERREGRGVEEGRGGGRERRGEGEEGGERRGKGQVEEGRGRWMEDREIEKH